MFLRPPTSPLFPYPAPSRSQMRRAQVVRDVVHGLGGQLGQRGRLDGEEPPATGAVHDVHSLVREDRKSTRLNSSHANISYADFCLKKQRLKTHNSTICKSHL